MTLGAQRCRQTAPFPSPATWLLSGQPLDPSEAHSANVPGASADPGLAVPGDPGWPPLPIPERLAPPAASPGPGDSQVASTLLASLRGRLRDARDGGVGSCPSSGGGPAGRDVLGACGLLCPCCCRPLGQLLPHPSCSGMDVGMASERPGGVGREGPKCVARGVSDWGVDPGGGQGQEVALNPTVLCSCLQCWWLEVPRADGPGVPLVGHPVTQKVTSWARDSPRPLCWGPAFPGSTTRGSVELGPAGGGCGGCGGPWPRRREAWPGPRRP